ncbi:hypothetical protein EDD15DRAFT_2203663 [Pisolithus albus]|nr:hypothetical protein EDD15DRAFT_2203663 [Pisolithus albus]
MSVSRDGNVLVVSNVTSGFDIYHLNDSSLDGSMLQPSNGMLVPVAFIHGGQAILGGSTCGKVQIWDSTDRSLLGTLVHDTKDVVLSIAVEPMSKVGKIGSLSLQGRVLWRDEEAMFNYGMPSRLKMLPLRIQVLADSDTHGIIKEGGAAGTFSGLRWLEIATVILVSVGAYVLGSLVGLPYRGA